MKRTTKKPTEFHRNCPKCGDIIYYTNKHNFERILKTNPPCRPCSNKEKAKDWTGQKLGMLTFIRKTGRQTRSGNFYWEAKCDCGNTCYVVPSTTYYRTFSKKNIQQREKRRGTVSCGCLKASQADQTRKYDPRITSARSVWRTYKDGLDFETFLSLSRQPCFYCGSPPYKNFNRGRTRLRSGDQVSINQLDNGDFIYNGLDRVDSMKGHTPDNVVPCCYRCNCAKNNMSFNDFISHIEKMYEHTRRFRQDQCLAGQLLPSTK